MTTTTDTIPFIKTIHDGEEVENFSEESDEEIEVSKKLSQNLNLL